MGTCHTILSVYPHTSKGGKGHRRFAGLSRAYGNTFDGSLCVVFRSWKETEGSGIKQLKASDVRRECLRSQEGELSEELPIIPSKVLLTRALVCCLVPTSLQSPYSLSPRNSSLCPTPPQVSTPKGQGSSEHLFHNSTSL